LLLGLDQADHTPVMSLGATYPKAREHAVIYLEAMAESEEIDGRGGRGRIGGGRRDGRGV
jgi:hypothetical protein